MSRYLDISSDYWINLMRTDPVKYYQQVSSKHYALWSGDEYYGFLYIIECLDFVKVGFSSRVNWRLYTWFNYENDTSPYGLVPLRKLGAEVLGIFPCLSGFEKDIHKTFRHEQVDMRPPHSREYVVLGHQSDWYPKNGELHAFVKTLKLIHANRGWYQCDQLPLV